MAMALKEDGNNYFKKGKFSAAVEAYTNAITMEPNEPALFTNRALCHQKLGRWQPSVDDARKAISIDARNVKAHHLLGKALVELEKFTEGKDMLTKALSLSSNSTALWRADIELALKHVRKKEWEQQRAKQISESHEIEGFAAMVLSEWREKHSGQDDALAAASKFQGSFQKLLDSCSAEHTVEEVPESFLCPITFSVMHDPVIGPSGNTFERTAIMAHLKTNAWDPVSRAPMRPDQLYPNLGLKAAIEKYQEENPWAYFE